jgi:hypothetical protein
MGRTVVLAAAGVLAVTSLPLPSAAAPALAVDECTSAPVEVAVVGPFEDALWPMILGDRVWFGGTIFTPAGTPLGVAPLDSVSPGTMSFDSDDGWATVSWGVVGDRPDDEPGGAIYLTDGSKLVDVGNDAAGAAVYVDDQYILVSEGYLSHPDDTVRVFLVHRSGTVVELEGEGLEETGRFGTMSEGRVYLLVHGDGLLGRGGGIGVFDVNGTLLGVLPGTTGREFAEIFSDHGYVYAVDHGHTTGRGSLWVFRDGQLVRSVEFPDRIGPAGPTAHGIAVSVLEPDPADEGAYLRRIELLASDGTGVATPAEPGTDLDQATIFGTAGRYLLLRSERDDLPADGSTERPYRWALDLFLDDGTRLGRTPEVTSGSFDPGTAAGKTLVSIGPGRHSVVFRTLSGVVLSTFAFGDDADPMWVEEGIRTDDRYVWVLTIEVASTVERRSAHVFDLGPCAGVPDPGPFGDDDLSVFGADIEWLAAAGVTRGCNPPANDRFCPNDPVTRGQMAAFLVRALELPAGPGGFTDTTTSEFAADIAALAAAGVTRGCNPPANDRFCPNDPVTRGQMAGFLHRVY